METKVSLPRIPLRMHLENSLTVIVPTACLHNFAINDGDFIEKESLKLQWNLSL